MPSGTQPHPLQLSILLLWRAQDGGWGGALRSAQDGLRNEAPWERGLRVVSPVPRIGM